MTVRYAFVCDFDGTISPRDIGAEFVRAFSPGRDAERRGLLDAWRSDAIGSRELTEAECSMVRVEEPEALAFVRRFGIDPHFAAFVRAAERRADRVLVASDGFEFYIDALLGRAGLGGVPRAANRLAFRDGGVVPEFPFAGRGCGRCGNCKGAHARGLREEGYLVVVVGDGYSDRCAVRVADHVLARGSLAEWCAAERIAAEPFADFADVARIADRLPGRNGG